MFSKATRRRSGAALMAAVGATAGLVATGAAASAAGKVTLVFTSQYNGNNSLDNWITAAAKVFEKTHPNVTVAIRNIVTDSESTYYAKLDLAERSSSTTPDISYEDSFLVQSDAAAGYIRALPQLTSNPEWKNQYSVFHSMTEYNGVPYGMMIETDVQQLYYDMALFKKAGLPTNWQPKTWADIITAAKAIKAHDPGVTPLWIYTGTPMGEASSFRGFEVLLGGTNDWLYNSATKKWETGGPGFNAVFNFLETLQKDGLTESANYWSNPNGGNTVATQLIPQQQVGIDMDGSWVSTFWLPGWEQALAAGLQDVQRGRLADRKRAGSRCDQRVRWLDAGRPGQVPERLPRRPVHRGSHHALSPGQLRRRDRPAPGGAERGQQPDVQKPGEGRPAVCKSHDVRGAHDI